MIGSRLDLAIRHRQETRFKVGFPSSENDTFQDVDIGRGFFIILGSLRHLPYFYTNDPTQMHLAKENCVRVFTYDSMDRGKKLSYFFQDYQTKKRGDLLMASNNGKESLTPKSFFDFCPHETASSTYMAYVYHQTLFDIDALSNKMVMSPGHLFTKWFAKYLYGPLRDGDWSCVKTKYAWVVKSIETGSLLHVLSRKTDYFKEGKSVVKMTNTTKESHREIGANGQVFVEKAMGCYREVNMQTYPLNPYLTYMLVRQMSSKVKSNVVPPYHWSYLGFLCISGCFETKNVGRTTMMVRDTVVSTCNVLDPVFHDATKASLWQYLNLEPEQTSDYFVVVNEACIPVTEACYQSVDLEGLKRTFRLVECYEKLPFIHIRYKAGILFKQIPGTNVWASPQDLQFWCRRLLQLETIDDAITQFGNDFVTSFHVDLNPFFNHNYFPKNILAFNALKNAVLATDPRFHYYFLDGLSAYARRLTPYHHTLMEPVNDGISPHFALKIPQVMVAYMSFQGCTQEDSIVCRKDVDAFDSCRFYTIRVKLEADGLVRFIPRQDYASSIVGTLIHYGDLPLVVEPCSTHVRAEHITSQSVQLVFSKMPFRVTKYYLTSHLLSICIATDHSTNTGDKLCSFHSQKGVLRIMDKLPVLDGTVEPDLLVNPYGLFRMTFGQILEGIFWGNAKDATTVCNTDGQLIPGASALYASTLYFAIMFLSIEHIYYPKECVIDKITGQASKGRSRGGGMRLGNMELFNGMQGNGMRSVQEEKCYEHGDRTISVVPKSSGLVQEDARIFKCEFVFEIEPNATLKNPEVLAQLSEEPALKRNELSFKETLKVHAV
ncbi:hypothetical protein JTE90_016335 [Oedothorax gibbosus]|uniref:DNA-directed RNA polymerase n=1 Tax=Oedothorax gibbosus TaxID=931172 RepID=A0AAV6TQF6_9ARAC|nr:hypothetical protein JTE90_016335 [Oedothorax gibbosus]